MRVMLKLSHIRHIIVQLKDNIGSQYNTYPETNVDKAMIAFSGSVFKLLLL